MPNRIETVIIVLGWTAMIGVALWVWEIQLAGSVAQ